MSGLSGDDAAMLAAVATAASRGAYAPYSRFHVGAALLFADGAIITGANVENASYGLSLCAETNAITKALNEGRRDGLIAVAVAGGAPNSDGEAVPGPGPVTPCGRCRQVLNELAQLGGTDPEVICAADGSLLRTTLSALLPHAFGPANFG